MHKWMTWCALGSALVAAVACSEDSEEDVPVNVGGQPNDDEPSTGNAGGTGGTGAAGGTSGAAGGTGGAVGGMGGAGGGMGGAPAVTCDPPMSDGMDAMGGMGGATGGELAITGSYTDPTFGGSLEVTSYAITSFSTVYVTDYDNAAGWVVGQNSEDDQYNPCTYSRFDWLEQDDKLHWCQTVFSAPTEAAAIAQPRADESDLQKGCGGFPWTTYESK